MISLRRKEEKVVKFISPFTSRSSCSPLCVGLAEHQMVRGGWLFQENPVRHTLILAWNEQSLLQSIERLGEEKNLRIKSVCQFKQMLYIMARNRTTFSLQKTNPLCHSFLVKKRNTWYLRTKEYSGALFKTESLNHTSSNSFLKRSTANRSARLLAFSPGIAIGLHL